MKFSTIATILPLALAQPFDKRDSPAVCSVEGRRGQFPPQVFNSALAIIPGAGSATACAAQCNLPANAACRSFLVREASTNSAGSCRLYSSDISASFIPRTTAFTAFYVNPAPIEGFTPHNNPAWYAVDNSKTRGTFEGCRGLCLLDAPRCRGFGWKPQGNCRLYEVSLEGRVAVKSPDPSNYFHGQVDCEYTPPAAQG